MLTALLDHYHTVSVRWRQLFNQEPPPAAKTVVHLAAQIRALTANVNGRVHPQAGAPVRVNVLQWEEAPDGLYVYVEALDAEGRRCRHARLPMPDTKARGDTAPPRSFEIGFDGTKWTVAPKEAA